MSKSLWPHRLQHARLSCPSPTPGAGSDSCPSSWWSHTTISSSVVPFSSCFQSFPASGSFQMSQLFVSGGQSIGVSYWTSTSVLPMNTQDWSPLGWTGWITLQSKGLSKVGLKKQFIDPLTEKSEAIWPTSHEELWPQQGTERTHYILLPSGKQINMRCFSSLVIGPKTWNMYLAESSILH